MKYMPYIPREGIQSLFEALDIPQPLQVFNPKSGRFHSFFELRIRPGVIWHGIELPEKLALRISLSDFPLKPNTLFNRSALDQDSTAKTSYRDEIACMLYAKYTGLGPSVYSFSTIPSNPLKMPYVLMEVAPGERLSDQLLSLSLSQLYLFSEAFVSLMACRQHLLGPSGQIVAAAKLPDEDEPHNWTQAKVRSCFAIEPLSKPSKRPGYTPETSQYSEETSAAYSQSSIVQQIREQTQRLKYQMPSWELYEVEFTSLQEAFDLFDELRPPLPGSPTFPWHLDLYAYNILVYWETPCLPKITIIDWDGAYTASERWTVASPAEIMLAYKPFANSLSQEEKRELHSHALNLLGTAFPGTRCLDLAINHAFVTIMQILAGEFHDPERIELFIEFGEDWNSWKTTVNQEGYCILDDPPPAIGFWGPRSVDSTLQGSNGYMDFVTPGSTIIQNKDTSSFSCVPRVKADSDSIMLLTNDLTHVTRDQGIRPMVKASSDTYSRSTRLSALLLPTRKNESSMCDDYAFSASQFILMHKRREIATSHSLLQYNIWQGSQYMFNMICPQTAGLFNHPNISGFGAVTVSFIGSQLHIDKISPSHDEHRSKASRLLEAPSCRQNITDLSPRLPVQSEQYYAYFQQLPGYFDVWLFPQHCGTATPGLQETLHSTLIFCA